MISEVESFLKDKSITISFRIKVSQLSELLKGDTLTVEMRGKKFELKLVEK